MAITKERFTRGIILKADDIGVEGIEGELKVGLTSKKLHVYLDGALRSVVTESQSQSLSNKTIDADTNTIQNLEVDNLKAGVLNIDLVTGGPGTDLQVPSAKATQDLAVATATNAQTNLMGHINDDANAHAASAISNTPSGSITAINVQDAIDQLESQIASGSGGLQAHIDSTTAHTAANLVNVPSGNLSATTIQGALNELQSDVDTRALNTDLTAHTGASSGVHGVTGSVVGTTDTQTLTNKTLTAPVINNGSATGTSIVTPSRLDVKQDTKSNLITYALTAANGQIVFATDEKKMYQVVDTKLVSIGGGSASLDTVAQLVAEEQITDWSTGNNAAFLGGGTLAGTFVINTTAPLHNAADYKYTQAAGSLNDYFASAIQTVDARFRGQEVTLYFPYTYNGTTSSDIQAIVYCTTTSQIITSTVFVPVSTGVSIFKTNCTIPLGCQGIRVGFQVKSLSSGAVFEFDDVQVTSNTTVMADIVNQRQGLAFFSATNSILLQNGTKYGNSNNLLSFAGNTATVLNPCTVHAWVSSRATGTGSAAFLQSTITFSRQSLAPSDLATGGSGTGLASNASGVMDLQPGDTIVFSVGNGTSTFLNLTVGISATASNQNILTAPDTFSTDTAPLVYAPSSQYTLATLANAPVGTFITFAYNTINSNTRTQTTTAPTQTTADMNANGILLYNRPYNGTALGTTALSAIAIQIGKGLKGKTLDLYKSTGKNTAGSLDIFYVGTTTKFGATYKEYNEATGILFIDSGISDVGVTNASFSFIDAVNQSTGYLVINASKNPALTGLNINAVAARAVQSSGQSIPNTNVSTNIVYDSVKTYDTHGALNTTTGVFTAPESGYYQVNGGVLYANGTAWAVGNIVDIGILKNGTAITNGKRDNVSVASSINFYGAIVSDVIFLARGDTCNLVTSHNRTAGAASLITNQNWNFFSITKTSVG